LTETSQYGILKIKDGGITMKKLKLAILFVLLCLLLAACRSKKDVAWNDAPSVPDDLVFQINGTCDLVDADGKTLHCGSPNDFYGTIEGKDGYMTGNGAFEFTVPYSAYYRFKPESRVPSILAMRGLFSELELKGPAEEIEWRLSGWSIKSDGTGATLTDYTDRLAIGSHEYFARVFRTNGNYAQSNTVTGEMNVRYPMIAAFSGGPWISLRLSENRDREQDFSWSKKSSSTHIHGRTYPSQEQSPYETLTGSFDCAFMTVEESEAF
jgi:hypothetical protein